ncbi:DUF6531 domain-containing protein [Cellulomonas bogoriensis]|uniref:DUF6531 domain-containing protein n=1 Tax=Cellulomonas bogoriensis TaxID=301388 RepID=UPI0012EB95BE|nr:DUF6531 domain-containing protein [Cellulomonas bogoriensis]
MSSDGETTTTEIFAQPAFRLGEDGWVEVDATIEAGSGEYPFEAPGLVNPVRFGTSASALVTIETLEGSVSLGLPDAAVSAPTLGETGSTVTYSEVYPGVDLTFSTATGRLGVQVALAGPDARRDFEFVLDDVDGVLGEAVEDEAGGLSFDGHVAFGTGLRISAPSAWASGPAPGAEVVSETGRPAGQGPDHRLDLSLNLDGFDEVEFPVVLDQAIEWTDEVWEYGLGLEVAYAPVGEAACGGGPCPLVAPSEPWVPIGTPSDHPGTGSYLTYVGADLSALEGRRVVAASLGADTWNIYPRVNDICENMSAGSTGADLAAAICGPPKPMVAWYLYSGWYSDVTDSVRRAVSGLGSTGHVAGFAIGHEKAHGSWETPDPDSPYDYGAYTQIPSLRVEYLGFPVPRPLTLGQTFGCVCWGGTSTMNQALAADPINTATGAFTEQFRDLAIPGVGESISLTRTYNSLDPRTGPFGPGWSFGYGASLAPDDDGYLVLRDGSGTQSRFAALPDGEYVAVDAAVSAQVGDVPDQDLRWAQSLSGDAMVFDLDGRLQNMFDERGDGLTLTYDGDELRSLTDQVGQTLTFTWDEGRITSATSFDGRTVTYEYAQVAGDRRLVAVTAVDGATTRFDYDETTGAVSQVTDPLGNVRAKNTYDPQTGRVLSQVDQLGEVTTFAWDAEAEIATVTDPTGAVRVDEYRGNNLVRQVDPNGAVVETLYDANNNIAGVVDAHGEMSFRIWDERNRLIATRSPVGSEITWEYDYQNRVVAMRDAEWNQTRYDYTNGLLVAEWFPDGGRTLYTYTTGQDEAPAHLLASVTDPLGRTTTYSHDAVGNVVAVTDPTGATSTVDYDEARRPVRTTDPTGSTTSYTYDGAGRVLTVTDPVGGVTTKEYDDAGRLVQVTAPDGMWTRYTHDAADRVVEVEDSAGATAHTSYDANGRVVEVTDDLGATTSFEYDPAGRLVTQIDPLGRSATSGYDPVGNLVELTAPSGATTTFGYDAAGRQVSVTDPLGAVSTTTYDMADRPIRVQDPTGRWAETMYDPMGRVVYLTRANYTALRWDYDQAGQLTSYTDADGNETTYTYDDAGRRATRTDPFNRQTAYAYDAAGRMTVVTAPDGTTTEYTFDQAGRTVGIAHDGPTPDVALTYDPVGRRTSMADGTGTTSYTYDAAGRLASATAPAGEVGYAWDTVGRLTELTYPDGTTVQRSYDSAGQLTQITDWSGQTYQLTYGEDSQLQEVTFPNGVQTSYGHDAAGRRTSIDVGGALLALAYDYDEAGLLAEQSADREATQGASSYDWDALARLSEVTGTGAGRVTYTRAEQVSSLPDGTRLTYARGQLTTRSASGGTTAYEYDDRGNRTAEATATAARTLTYDSADRLTDVTGVDNTVWSYTYDGDGLRAGATTQGPDSDPVTETYVWDTTATVPTLLQDATHTYLYGFGSAPLAQRDSTGTIQYLHTDLIGSVRTVTDAAGDNLAHADYTPFGTPVDPQATPVADITRFGFAGEYTDHTGYIYLRHRYYDPATAQFLTVDPLLDQTRSPYGYTHGNPLQYVDPLGLAWLDALRDEQGGWIVSNAVASFDAGLTNSVISVANSMLALVIDPGGVQIPYMDDPNCNEIYHGSYVSGEIVGAIATIGFGIRAGGTGRLGSAPGKAGGAANTSAGRGPAVTYGPGAQRAGQPSWPVQQGGNCTQCAQQIQRTMGGEIVTIKPNAPGASVLGPSANNPAGNWTYHDVVVRNGRVYDSFTGPNGMPLDRFKSQFEYWDAIDFGF